MAKTKKKDKKKDERSQVYKILSGEAKPKSIRPDKKERVTLGQGLTKSTKTDIEERTVPKVTGVRRPLTPDILSKDTQGLTAAQRALLGLDKPALLTDGRVSKEPDYISQPGGQGTTSLAPTDPGFIPSPDAEPILTTQQQASLAAEEQARLDATSQPPSFTQNPDRAPTDPDFITGVIDGEEVQMSEAEFDKMQELRLNRLKFQGVGEPLPSTPETAPQVDQAKTVFAQINAAKQNALFNPFEEMPDVKDQASVWGSTFREAGMGAAAGFAAGLVPAGIAASTVVGAPAVPFILAGTTIGGFIVGLYKKYGANHKEEVTNAWDGFSGLRSGIPQIATALRMGAISPQQARLNYNLGMERIKSIRMRLYEKTQTSYMRDVADADGKLEYIDNYIAMYMEASISPQIAMTERDPTMAQFIEIIDNPPLPNEEKTGGWFS